MKRSNHIPTDFYIMKAAHLTSSGRKLGLTKILRDEPNCTIVIATRHYGYDKTSECFIIGCRGSYGIKPGDTKSYTIDTGMGYRMNGERLDIEHILQVENGKVVESDGRKRRPDCPPEMDARYTWVMK